MKLYIMRHGHTVWIDKRKIQGQSNNRLSKRGIEETEKIALKNKELKIDVIYCSPLMRTMQTANLFNKYHKVKIIKNKNLIEIAQGVFTGKQKANLTEEEKQIRKLRQKSYGMESYKEVYNRAKEFMELVKTDKKYNSILIVTHNIVASLLEQIIKNNKVDFSNKQQLNCFENSQIKQFEI